MMPNGSFSRYRVDDSSYETYAATRISADRWCHCCDWQCSDFDASRVRENPQVLATLNDLTVGLLLREGHTNAAAGRRIYAAFPQHAFNLLTAA